MVKLGSLFSGIGLLDLGLENVGFETVFQVEWNKHATALLETRWPTIPHYADITQVDWSTVPSVDALAGGFPCQPFSSAGLRKGASDERWMWPEYLRAICGLRPRMVIVENVAALLGSPEWGTILGDLAEAGYDAKWRVLRASDVGAPHRRERIFLVAYVDRERRQRWDEKTGNLDGHMGTCAYAERTRLQRQSESSVERPSKPAEVDWEAIAHSGSTGSWGEKYQRGQPGGSYWGSYEPAVRRWERVTRPVPNPTDERGRLSVGFVEWMMGAPADWIGYRPCGNHQNRPKPGCPTCRMERQGTSRTQALKGLGNGVVAQVAEEIGRWALNGRLD